MKVLLLSLVLVLSKLSFSQLNKDTIDIEMIDQMKRQKILGTELNEFYAESDKEVIYNNDSLKGKVTLVNFWFEGCEPCVVEFDELNSIYEQFRGNKNFQLLAFTFETKEAVKRIREKYGLKYDIILISGKLCQTLNFGLGFPVNIITNQSSKIIHINDGGYIEKAKVKEYFDEVIIPKINKLLTSTNPRSK